MTHVDTYQDQPLRDHERGSVATAARHAILTLHSALRTLRTSQEGCRPRTDACPLARGQRRTWSLADGSTLRLAPTGAPLAIRCLSGTSLVTQEGDPADHVLEPGGELVTSPRGLVVVWALSATDVAAAA